MFRTELPGTYCYLVPFRTVDPDRIEVTAPHRLRPGEPQIAPRQERQNPLAPATLRFLGLHPGPARQLVRGELARHEATTVGVPAGTVHWQVTFRDLEAARRLLADLARRGRPTGR